MVLHPCSIPAYNNLDEFVAIACSHSKVFRFPLSCQQKSPSNLPDITLHRPLGLLLPGTKVFFGWPNYVSCWIYNLGCFVSFSHFTLPLCLPLCFPSLLLLFCHLRLSAQLYLSARLCPSAWPPFSSSFNAVVQPSCFILMTCVVIKVRKLVSIYSMVYKIICRTTQLRPAMSCRLRLLDILFVHLC